MPKSKYQPSLFGKDGRDVSKRTKVQRRGGGRGSNIWLKTRRRVRRKMLGG